MRRFLIVVVALVAIVALVAGIAEWLLRPEVEKVVNTQVQSALGAPVTTKVHDRFVLPGLAADRLEQVTGEADRPRLQQGDQQVVLDRLSFTATGIRQLRSTQGPIADHLDVSASLGWAEAVRVTGVQMTPLTGGRVEIRHQIEIWGAQVPITLSALPGVDPESRRFTLTAPAATLSGVEVPQSLLVPLLAKLTEKATLPDVMGLRYTSLKASGSGIAITLAGEKVRLHR